MNAKDILKALLSSWVGRIGAGFLAFMIIISFYVVLTYPLDFGTRIWNNPAYWADYPQSVPPAWSNAFSSDDQVVHKVFTADNPGNVVIDGSARYLVYRFRYDYSFENFPTFTSFTINNVNYESQPPVMSLSIIRPDNSEVLLLRHVVPGPAPGEVSPYVRYADTAYRVYLSGDRSVAYNVRDFINNEYGIGLSLAQVEGQVDRILFGEPDGTGGFKPLVGEYVIDLTVLTTGEDDYIGEVSFTIGGTVYGLMGTDSTGRDLATGLLFGFPVALLIGVVTSVFITVIGTTTGIISGYVGGRTDTLIQRLCDVLANIPLLPILIFLAFIFGQKLWLVMLVLVVFGWPGLTIIVRSMVLHQSASQLVEATRALGASPSRIMFRHVLFQIGPFVLAQMIFATPGAILAEAGLSFLGLGDPSIPTWGQILESGFSTGAVYVGYWWWVLPPGLLVVFAAATFVLLSLGFEPVVNPKLRKHAAT
ncbi:MAG: ABC transporter permease [Dehalogenimonas sp.]|uniref:ABC transporter permease n=1 Tax=Candidatus Dehalogenimonas loeffleri TaxID=3127115 RepID=A0ABZ2J6V8_9CHLR|nr:ABC transporter permease [Dehalogenimonas sp.]